MPETSASTPYTGKVREWASEWADVYAQDYDEQKLSDLVGKHVKGTAEVAGEAKGFVGWIVGFSIDTLIVPEDEDEQDDDWHPQVKRYSLITADGLACPIFAGMVIEEAEEE